jgi:hypothetical protein
MDTLRVAKIWTLYLSGLEGIYSFWTLSCSWIEGLKHHLLLIALTRYKYPVYIYLVIASQNIFNLKIYWNDIFYFLKYIALTRYLCFTILY